MKFKDYGYATVTTSIHARDILKKMSKDMNVPIGKLFHAIVEDFSKSGKSVETSTITKIKK